MADSPGGEVVVYEAPDGEVRVEVKLDRDTVWLTQRQMADLFDTSTDNVGLHLKNIFGDGELEEAATAENFSVVQSEGKRRVR
ncbi:MAG: DNA-binding protein, partial [Bradyrhizobium sp.]|nr:DNA-binding protein [Bradyrhizobium sp.]